ncbi:MAG: hypothetical protein ACRDKW_02080 [Actinomycetota bacterium]
MAESTTGRSTGRGRLSAVKDALPDAGHVKQQAASVKQQAASAKGQAARKATAIKSDIRQGAGKAATEIKQTAGKAATEIKETAARAKEGAAKAATGVKEGVTGNPLTLGLLSAASGFAVGMLVPLTPIETQRLPQLAERARDLTYETIQNTRRSGMETAADQIESVGGAAIEAMAEVAKKIPGVSSVADKVEASAKRGARKVAATVREKAAT